jgi:hypothetical protein
MVYNDPRSLSKSGARLMSPKASFCSRVLDRDGIAAKNS